MGYLALLDAVIPYNLIKEIGLDPKQVRFDWPIAVMQLHVFKILPYIHSQPLLLKTLEYDRIHSTNSKGTYTWSQIIRWYTNMHKNYHNYGVGALKKCKYNPWRRIQHRWMEHKGYLSARGSPYIKLEELSFKPLLKTKKKGAM